MEGNDYRMKKFIVLIISVLVIAAICYGGWTLINSSKSKNENKTVEENTKDKDSNTSDEKEKSLDNSNIDKDTNDDMYKSIINEYKKAFNEYDMEDIDSAEKLEKNYNLVSPTLIEHVARYNSEGVKLTYTLYDIDNNGVQELIVGADGSAGAIYTYDKDTNKIIKIYYQDTMERGNLVIYDNGVILSEGSGGAALHYYEFGKISKNGQSYELLESIEEEYEEDKDIPVYRDSKTEKTLNYKSLDDIMEKYLSSSKKIDISKYNEL